MMRGGLLTSSIISLAVYAFNFLKTITQRRDAKYFRYTVGIGRSSSVRSSRSTSITPNCVRMHVSRCLFASSRNSDFSEGKNVLTNTHLTDRFFGKHTDTEFCRYLEKGARR